MAKSPTGEVQERVGDLLAVQGSHGVEVRPLSTANDVDIQDRHSF